MAQWLPAFLVLVPALLWFFTPVPAPPVQDTAERLARHRNLGKAFYENPTTQKEAVNEFRQALALAADSARERLNYGLALLRAGQVREGTAELLRVQKQNPALPHTWFNLGIVYKKAGEPEKAIPQLERFVALVQDDPIGHYNLGAVYKLAGRTEDALKEFIKASQLDSALAAPHFQLYNAYRTSSRPEDARRELARFQEIKKKQEGAAIPEDIEWNAWAEILDAADDRPPASVQAVTPAFEVKRLPGKASGAMFLDVNGDGHLHAVTWSSEGLRVDGSLTAEGVREIRFATAGDFNNDGLPDLAALTPERPVLLRNTGGGKFEALSGNPFPQGNFTAAVWIDYDHDYDLDLILLGSQAMLLRNAGSAGFQDRTVDFPFVSGKATATGGAVLRVLPDTKGFDLAVSYADRSGTLYRDHLQGRYTAEDLPIAAGANNLRVSDSDNDSYPDVIYEQDGSVWRLPNRKGSFATPLRMEARSSLAADLDNRGVMTPVSSAGLPSDCRPVDVADSNEDGLNDLLCISESSGTGSLLVNKTALPQPRRFARIRLAGVKNLKTAPYSEIEVKAGPRYQKRFYTGTGPLTIGLGAETVADTVRITWPNGLIQNEIRQAAGKTYRYEEAQRLSGSCPIVWTWDGTGFRYITDVLGVAPLGASSGDGSYFPADHDEYIQISGDALHVRPEDATFEIRITEELSEAAYLDQVQLLAIDHPAGTDVYTNEKFKGPPFPEFRLFEVETRIRPIRARDDKGNDVLKPVLQKDRKYPTTFRRDLAGTAELHSIELDFGSRPTIANASLLVLSGWVDWADGSTFLAAAQEGKGGLIPPYLQVRDEKGRWVTVLEDMGMPAGKPKTIAVDLSSKWLSASREVRIVTNLCVYWDEVFLSPDVKAPANAPNITRLSSASLHFRGFSPNKVHPQRLQPEEFRYDGATPVSLWNPTPGLYTRYGDVRELATEVDDRLIVMGSGDEAILRFDSRSLPQLRQGMQRDFLLKVDGWAKDRDANTAFSQNTEPLPFHRMSRYPYGPQEQFPTDEAHRAWRREYLTRPALRLVRPLTAMR